MKRIAMLAAALLVVFGAAAIGSESSLAAVPVRDVAPSVTSATTARASSADANCDEADALDDALYVRRVVAGVETGSGCDIDPDGSGGPLDAADALFIMRALAGLVPLVTSLSPSSAVAGGAPFTLTVDGSGFAPGITVTFDGQPVPTTYVNPTRVTASISTENLAFEGDLTVTAQSAGGGVSNATTFTATPGLDSYELIDAAVTANNLDAGTALLYKLYADTGDSRLPAQYASSVVPPNPDAFAQLVRDYAGLTPSLQSATAPFLLAPDAPGSWFYLRETEPANFSRDLPAECANVSQPGAFPDPSWHEVTNGDISVWWHECDEFSQDVAEVIAEIMSDTVFPVLTALMGPPPGDGTVDVYIMPGQQFGVTVPIATCPGPSRILLGSGSFKGHNSGVMASTAMTLLTNKFARATSCEETKWLTQSTATWAQDYVFPLLNYEHVWAQQFVEQESTSIEGADPFGAYLWWFYLTREYGPDGSQAVRETFDFLATSDALTAFYLGSEAGTSKGMSLIWPKFVMYNWNDFRPVGSVDKYWRWDRLQAQVPPSFESLNLGGGTSVTKTLDKPLPHMSATYYDFSISPNIKLLSFDPVTNAGSSFSVQVFYYNDETTAWEPAVNQPDDFTASSGFNYCLERPGEHFSEIVIILGNASFSIETNEEPPVLTGYSSCGGWQGSLSSVQVLDSTVQRLTTTMTGSVTFLEKDQEIYAGILGVISSYLDIEWLTEYPECTMTFHLSGPAEFPTGDDFLWFNLGLTFDEEFGIDPEAVVYSVALGAYIPGNQSRPCDDDTVSIQGLTALFHVPFPTTLNWTPNIFYPEPDGNTLTGTATFSGVDGATAISVSESWTFTRCAANGVALSDGHGGFLPDCNMNQP